MHETTPQSFYLFLVESKPVYWRKLFYQCDLAQPCALVLSAAECSVIVSHPSKAGLQMMNTAILVLLCYYNSATGIQGCFSKKFTQSVIESVFQSVLRFITFLHNTLLAKFPTILDSFINTTSTYIRVVGSHEVAGYCRAQQFSR